MEQFRNTYRNASKEWAYEVDSQGYVHQFVEGMAHSVAISGRRLDSFILHNHPSGGAFSKADMKNVSMGMHKGIVASGKNYDYVFEKGTHFKAAQFVKAVDRAQMKGKDYSDAVDKWLTANQKKYGYKYYRKKFK